LTDEHPQETLEHKIVVGFESLKDDGLSSRMFAVFDSYIELYLYQRPIPPERKNFYEIIIGEFPQKPHFDVDIKEAEITEGVDIDELCEAVKDNLIECVIKVCESVGVKLDVATDILLYQSHSHPTHTTQKRSFHLVVHHYCHSDHHQALAFYEQVTEKMKEEYAIYVDHSVYSSKQNFRLFGHQKLSSGRPKLFQTPMLYRGELITHIYDIDLGSESDPKKAEDLLRLETLKESLVSWIEDCEYLPSFQSEEERRKKKSYEDLGDLPPETIKEAEVLITKRDFPFVIRDVKGSIISLRRLRPSFCEICKRVHEHENPYLLVVEDNVYFCCRRNTEKKLLLGKAESNLKVVNELLEEEVDSEEDGCYLDLGGYVPKASPELPRKPQLTILKKEMDALEMLKHSNLILKSPAVDTVASEKLLRRRDHAKNMKDQKFLSIDLPEIRPAMGFW